MPLYIYIQIFTQTKPTVLIPFQFRVDFWINLISGDSLLFVVIKQYWPYMSYPLSLPGIMNLLI